MSVNARVIISRRGMDGILKSADVMVARAAKAAVLLCEKHAPAEWGSIIDEIKVAPRKRHGIRMIKFEHYATHWMHNGFMHVKSGKFIPGIPFFRKALAEVGAKMGGGGGLR